MHSVICTVILVLALVAGVVVSAVIGQLDVGPREVLGALLDRLGIDTGWRPDDLIADAVWFIRMPRVVMSLLVGLCLAIAGVMMQAIFGNPLAEPGVVGVSSGAALGAAIAIAAGWERFGGGWAIAASAFVVGLLATAFVYSTARREGRTEVVTLLLTGIAVNAFAGAGLAFVLFAGDTGSREQIVFWQLGTINGTRWIEVLPVAVVGMLGSIFALWVGRKYDVLSLGERSALHLGIRVERLRIASMAVIALLTGVAVAFTGIIAFVGLVIPHVMRMVIGPSHRGLILGSALAGAVLLVWSDVLARTLVEGADLPIGLMTSLVGGPFFLYLVRQSRSRSGGWA